jgi:3-(3-hydroxy-phenyl)propionate hydroxylase
VQVRFSQKFAGFDQDADGVTVHVEGQQDLRASYLAGADGARSAVRHGMDVEFEGFTWPERFVVASTTYDLGSLGFSGAGYIADPENWAAIFHVPDAGPPGIWRLAYPSDPQVPDAEALSPGQIQQRLGTILEPTGADPAGGAFELKYASSYRVHQRVAKIFVKGRVAIMGDAAHVNNPLGGMGLNCAVHDAVNLAGKLCEIWHHGAPRQKLLDLYDRQRRTMNIKAVQAMSIRNKNLLEEKDPVIRRARLDELRALTADPVRTKEYLMNTSMINSVREAAQIQ